MLASTGLRTFTLVILLAAVPCLSETTPAMPSGSAAFLFAYYPKPGMQQLFDEGYRRHLKWHQEKKDPLVWYAWYVVTGKQTGLFIDGSFGAPFASFDARPEPQADASDFAQTSAPFSETAFRSVYSLRADLSTGQLLEDRQPSPFIEVTYYVLHSGMEHRFERIIGKLRAALAKAEGAPIHTWYELLVGGEHPGYLLMVPHRGWSDYESAREPMASLLERAHGSGEAEALLEELAATVAQARSETWSYRKDLSYFPAQ